MSIVSSIFKTLYNRFLAGLLASFQDPERLFFVMEFLSGGDLMHHMMLVPHLLPSFVNSLPTKPCQGPANH